MSPPKAKPKDCSFVSRGPSSSKSKKKPEHSLLVLSNEVAASNKKNSILAYYSKVNHLPSENAVEDVNDNKDDKNASSDDPIIIDPDSAEVVISESTCCTTIRLTNSETESNLAHGTIIDTDLSIERMESEPIICCTLDQLRDPGKWPEVISNELRKTLVTTGPFQIKDLSFPLNNEKRRFTNQHYTCLKQNGEPKTRNWLVYSPSNDSVFCFPCKIVGRHKTPLSNQIGFSTWKQLSDHLLKHEQSRHHKDNLLSWITLRNGILQEKTVDQHELRLYNIEVKRWESVLKRLLQITKFLASRNLAFRGTEEKLFSPSNGNFLGIVELIAQFDPVLEDHVRKADTSEIKDHYLSKNIQNELIHLLAEESRKLIIRKCKEAKYFAVIVDCTRDLSKVEQTTIVIRYVDTSNRNCLSIEESFVGFFPAPDSTGEGLKDIIVNEITQLGLQVMDIRGQGYDNGANMKGQYQGVQRRILDLNPRAFYVPCACHSLNLMIGDAAASSVYSNNLFSFVQELYSFTSASGKRWEILKKYAHGFTIKPMCPTRWECRIDNVKAVRFQVGEIYDSLVEMSNVLDPKFRAEAIGLAKKLKQFDILLALVVWYEVLFRVNLASKTFQNIETNLEAATVEWNKILNFLTDFRENGFKKCRESAVIISREVEGEQNFVQTSTLRPRRKKTNFSYEGADEQIIDPEQKFRIEFFNVVCDTTICSLRERFELMVAHTEKFGFICNISTTQLSDIDLLKHCKDLELCLTHNESKDILAIELCEEIKMLKPMLTSDLSDPLKLLQYIFKNNYEDACCNVVVLLRIYLTLPVTVASGERSFSKLRLIKNFLRTTMTQERLTDLAHISIESEVVSTLSVENLVTVFAQLKARRVNKHK